MAYEITKYFKRIYPGTFAEAWTCKSKWGTIKLGESEYLGNLRLNYVCRDLYVRLSGNLPESFSKHPDIANICEGIAVAFSTKSLCSTVDINVTYEDRCITIGCLSQDPTVLPNIQFDNSDVAALNKIAEQKQISVGYDRRFKLFKTIERYIQYIPTGPTATFEPFTPISRDPLTIAEIDEIIDNCFPALKETVEPAVAHPTACASSDEQF